MKRRKPWGSDWFSWSIWKEKNGRSTRIKTVVARTAKNRNMAPKRRKVLNRRLKG